MIISALRSHVVFSKLLGVAGLLFVARAGAYEIEYFGTLYDQRVDLQSAEVSHWDSFTWTYNPASQSLGVRNDGNSGINLGTQPFRIVPGAGENPGGDVPVTFSFATQELIQQVFTNFSAETFDHHFKFGLRILGSALPQGDEPILPLLNTEGNISYLTLDVSVDKTLFFDLVLDAADVHSVAPTFDSCSWKPQLIDAGNSGFAETSINGNVSLFSMEVVPEPGVGAMVVVGMLLLGRRLKARHSH